jgi:hypothetical protein
MSSTRCSCQILIKKTYFLDRFFEKCWNIKFHTNPSRGSRYFPCGRTDRHVEVDSRFFAILRTRLKTIKVQTNREPTVCSNSVSVGQQHTPRVVDVGIRCMPKSDTAVPHTLHGQMCSDFQPTHFRTLSGRCHVISKASTLFFTGVPTKIHRMCSVNCIDTGDIQLAITDGWWNDRVYVLLQLLATTWSMGKSVLRSYFSANERNSSSSVYPETAVFAVFITRITDCTQWEKDH